MTDKIPFLDLVTPHLEMEEELTDLFRAALRTAAFVGGRPVDEFEGGFAGFCGATHCVGVANGTDALLFALRAAGVQPGDVVVTAPNTFIATTEAITQAGALPEFVDVDARTSNLDPPRVERYLEHDCTRDAGGRLFSRRSGRPVTAIVPVHLYGQMADMDPILALAERFRLLVIEDACQAHGAQYFSRAENRWRTAGSLGRAAAFSFYPGKNLGACGEAGAVTTNDAALAETVRKLRDHGQSRKYIHEIEGYNGRLDAIQAAFLHAKLARLPEWTEGRRRAAAEYRRLFDGGEGVIVPDEPDWSRGVYHLYVIRAGRRDELIKCLAAEQIGTGIHYPIPLHLQAAYAHLGYTRGDFPVSEQLADEIVSLPMFPHLALAQQARVADAVRRFTGLSPARP
jgi:dTDP-4-amino-4,6-dideoxygalactose transaminase